VRYVSRITLGWFDGAQYPPQGEDVSDKERKLSLEVERLRVEAQWQAARDEFVPISLAAAATFHQVHPSSKAVVNRGDYEDALNIAASALSRIVPVYTVGAVTQRRVQVPVNLVLYRFVDGATQLRANDGKVFEALVVKRSDVLFAISIIKRAGLPFSFAVVPAEPPAAPPQRAAEDPKIRTLRRAIEILGSEKAVAEALDVKLEDIERWLSGDGLPADGSVYFAALEIVTGQAARPRE
jgi:hypothetical protein